MNSLAPTAVGFRLLFRRPLITFAEIAWRWTFAAAAWVLGTLFLFEYFDSLPVRTLDRLLLSTGQPFLIAQAFRRIFSGSSIRFTEAGILLGLCLTVAWIVLASLGRLVVLRSMLEEFDVPSNSRAAFRSLVFLNFLRVAVALATKIAALGSILMTSSLWASTHMQAGAAVRMVFLAWFLIWLAWAVLNWLLSVAAVFVVAEGRSSLAAIGAVLRLLQSRTAAMFAAGALFGVPHVVGLAVACGAVLVLLPVAAARPATLLLVFAVAFAHCFFADVFYTGRLAAYAFLAAGRDELPAWMARPAAPPFCASETRAAIDQDELILSDVPSPA